MDPQMVWDAMDECELEASKPASDDKKASQNKTADKKSTSSKTEDKPAPRYFGFPFGPTSR